jgi:hypothetical protein
MTINQTKNMIEKKYLKMMKALLVPVGPRATSGT